ncbi:MAG: hypothetical protein M3R70_06965 [Actinomycetota bacterium]|nr:hypothetical protein [Actinomycetota bacterium]
MPTRAALIAAALAVLGLPMALAASRSLERAALPRAKRAEFSRVAAPAGPAGLKPVRIGRPDPEPPWRHGVIASGHAPFSESALVIANQWQERIAGRHVSVYAGARGFDRRQGVVVVVEEAAPGASVYGTPSRTGALRITRARGLMLELRSAAGARYRFSVPGRRLTEVSK